MMMRKSKDAILRELKKAGYRMTKHRRTIIDFIAERQDHPSVRQIYNKIKINDPGISLATVYNTLNLLVELKLLKEIDFEESDNRYDTNLAPHLNLVCTICGSIIDFEYDIPVTPDVVQAKKGFVTKEYRMEYRGICNNCQDKK
jgi:Fur family peroxide stress response transcriptional regulator